MEAKYSDIDDFIKTSAHTIEQKLTKNFIEIK